MKNENVRVSLKTLSPMLKLCTAFASFPPYYFDDKFKTTGRRYKIYTAVFLVLVLCISSYQIYGTITCRSYNSTSVIIVLPHEFSNLFLSILAVRTSILNFKKCDELKLILHKLERFDKAIGRNSTRGKLFFTAFVVLHFVSLLTLILHAVVFAFNTELYKFNFAVYLLNYFYCTNLIMVVWIGLEIKFRYDTLNTFLYDFNYHLHDSNRSGDVLKNVSLHLKSVRMWHNGLCNLVEKYNELFGIGMLIFVLFEISSILSNTVVILDLLTFQKRSGENPLSGYMVFVCVLCLVSSLVRILALSLSSDNLAKAAGHMTIICYKLLNDVPVVPETDYDIMLNEKLHLIARQGFFRKPRVSGAGFFEINLEIMGTIATWVTAYVIVFVEFHIKKKK